MKAAHERVGLADVLRVAWGLARIAFLAGLAWAVWGVFSRTHVLEFQAGDASPLIQRLQAVAQQAAIEGLGFGLVALACCIFGFGLVRLFGLPRGTSERDRFGAAVTACGGAFLVWTVLASLAEDALPFLETSGILLLNVVALLACFAGLVLYSILVHALPWARGAKSSAIVCLAALASTLGVWKGLGLFRVEAHGLPLPLRVLAAGAPLLVGLPLCAFLAKRLGPLLTGLGARLAEGRLLPRIPGALLAVGLIGCTAVSLPSIRLSAVPHEASYATLEAPGEPQGPNVVYVTIDTLRADHLGCYGYERPTSPFIDSLAAGGARCAEPQAAAAWTKPATGTILTGLYPSRHGALYHGSMLQLPEGERTLAEAFRDAGYATAGFVTNPNIKKVFHFDRGFDEFFDSPVEDTLSLAAIRESLFGRVLTDLLRRQFNWKYENDVRTMNRHVLPWLEKNHTEPFFLYVHYIDPHIPYSPPEPYLSDFRRKHAGFPLFNERKRLVGIDLYDGEIRYSDDGIKELVEALQSHGIWDNTLFVLTSDHGEEFFEHGVLGHGFSLYEPVIRVPLLFHGPGVAPGTVIQDPVQIVDVAATVLDLAGTGDEQLGDGSSFAEWLRPNAGEAELLTIYLENEFGQSLTDHRSFVMKGVRRGRYKLVVTEANAFFPPQNPQYGSLALYDLEADPDETVNLFTLEESRPVVEELEALLDAHLLFLDETGFRDAAPAAMSAEIQQNLKALGY